MENRDLLLDTVTHDLVISGYNLQISEGIAATAQRIKIRLKNFLGEWFLDVDAGVPYYESILVKNPDITLIKSIIRAQILTVPTVTELLSFDFNLNAATRTLTIDFSCKTNNGTIEDSLVLP